MTEAYDWTAMPHRVSISCPACRSLADFEFAEIVRIKLSADVPFFKNNDAFEYQFFEDSNGSRWHGAIFYHGLKSSTPSVIRDLPEGYTSTAATDSTLGRLPAVRADIEGSTISGGRMKPSTKSTTGARSSGLSTESPQRSCWISSLPMTAEGKTENGGRS